MTILILAIISICKLLILNILSMENVITESLLIDLVMSMGFFLSALLSFACGVSTLLFGIVYRKSNLAKLLVLAVVGLAIIFCVAWGINELNWVAPSELSFAAIIVVAPSWLFFGASFVFLLVMDFSRLIKKNFGDQNQA